MLKKLRFRLVLVLTLAYSLSSCSVIGGIGKGLTNIIQGFSIHFR